MTSINDAKKVDITTNSDRRGNLAIVEPHAIGLFDIKRIFYMYGVPELSSRGGHALKECQQFIIALSGEFNVTVDDGYSKKVFNMTNPSEGLFVPNQVWRDLTDFSKDSICLVLASAPYDESDYIRSRADYYEYAAKIRPTNSQ